jgi:ribosomal protein S18 acetylase RimI-like enzyme
MDGRIFIMSEQQTTNPEYEASSIKIVRPTLDDVEKYRHVQGQEWLKVYPNDEANVSFEWVDAQVKAMLSEKALAVSRNRVRSLLQDNQHNFLYVAKDDDGAVYGMVYGIERDKKQELMAIYVDSDYHGTGVGQQLLDKVCKKFDAAEPILVEVADYNDRAIKFYQKNGFVAVPDSNHLFEENIPSIYMVRPGERVQERASGMEVIADMYLDQDDRDFIQGMPEEERLNYIYGKLLEQGEDPDAILQTAGVTEENRA